MADLMYNLNNLLVSAKRKENHYDPKSLKTEIMLLFLSRGKLDHAREYNFVGYE